MNTELNSGIMGWQNAKKISAPGKAVVKIGANFSTKEKNLAEWKVED